MRPKHLIVIGVAVAVVVAAIVFTGPVLHSTRYGTEFPMGQDGAGDERHSVAVDSGDRFSLVVRDNASIGDNWTLRERPSNAVLEREDHESSSGGTGGGGQRYYAFTAGSPGTSTIVLVNRFRGSAEHVVTVELTVR